MGEHHHFDAVQGAFGDPAHLIRCGDAVHTKIPSTEAWPISCDILFLDALATFIREPHRRGPDIPGVAGLYQNLATSTMPLKYLSSLVNSSNILALTMA
jgi:hypothetical protein